MNVTTSVWFLCRAEGSINLSRLLLSASKCMFFGLLVLEIFLSASIKLS